MMIRVRTRMPMKITMKMTRDLYIVLGLGLFGNEASQSFVNIGIGREDLRGREEEKRGERRRANVGMLGIEEEPENVVVSTGRNLDERKRDEDKDGDEDEDGGWGWGGDEDEEEDLVREEVRSEGRSPATFLLGLGNRANDRFVAHGQTLIVPEGDDKRGIR